MTDSQKPLEFRLETATVQEIKAGYKSIIDALVAKKVERLTTMAEGKHLILAHDLEALIKFDAQALAWAWLGQTASGFVEADYYVSEEMRDQSFRNYVVREALRDHYANSSSNIDLETQRLRQHAIVLLARQVGGIKW